MIEQKVIITIKEIGEEQISMSIKLEPSITFEELEKEHYGLAYAFMKAIKSIEEDSEVIKK